MHGLPVVNCGFVGAMSKHLVTYAHHVVALRPRLIVWCCGAADLVGPPEQPFETFKRALREFRGVHPSCPCPDAKANEIVMECLTTTSPHVPDDDVHHHAELPLTAREERDAPDFSCLSAAFHCFG
ncbi:hypothetical protein JL720_15796 [Aureococcus anophagefferens]|nr:hypothetical protein JL720_15796 [Aureococcus anophagefferens]